MDEQAIVERLVTLKKERQMLFAQMAAIEPKLAAYDGAIEDCEYWLAKIRATQNGQPASVEAEAEDG